MIKEGGGAVHTVIYLDVLLLTNGWIAVVLLAACAILCGQSVKWGRLVLAGAAAAGASLIILLPPFPFLLQILYQIGSAALIVGIAFPWKGIRAFTRQGIWYVLMNLLLAGGVSSACVRGVSWAESNNLCCYFQISPMVLLGSSLGLYLLFSVIRYLLGGFKTFCTLDLAGAGWQLQVSAYCDTGLTVVDPLTGKDVILLYYPAVKNRLPMAIQQGVDAMFASEIPQVSQYHFRLLACSTIGGQVMLPALPAYVKIAKERQPILLAFTMQDSADKRCEALFGADLEQRLQNKKRFHKQNKEEQHETVG